MNIAVLNTQIPFCTGGAEVLAEDLICSLRERGHQAALITVPFKWYPQQSLVDSILACKLMDIDGFNGVKIDKVIALKFPAWLMEHSDKALWILHQHRTAYELWDTKYNDLASMPDGQRIRDLIFGQDNAAISGCRKVYTISQNVSGRLLKFNHLDSGVLYPPPRSMEKFYHEEYGDYFFFPSRITPMKRQELVIEALAYCSPGVRVVFAGEADDGNYLEGLKRRAAELEVTEKIMWLGHITDEDKLDYYARCLMVIFPAYDEDYGYITPEAMLSSKGVVTLTDSGGSLEFVTDDENGCVVRPEANLLGEQLDRIWSDRALATLYGENAVERIAGMGISWDRVIGSLL
ncbi:MAG: glycosyltransferase family 4 protein [Halioglobus sp.]|nr:glycosyltransferase family 4 protein [Halioglobus sp.]